MESTQIFAQYDGKNAAFTLPDLCRDLLSEQIRDWPRLRDGYEALKAAKVRSVPCPEFTIRAQWNPQRIVSTAARVDQASLRERPCFLCRQNLPEAQRAILYRKDYLVLCNPAPIFERHFTVCHVRHRPQRIEPALETYLALLQDLSQDYSVLYNGPNSGASAPDHLHFQAAPFAMIPVERDIHAADKLIAVRSENGVDVFTAVELGRPFLVLKAVRQDCAAQGLLRTVAAMRTVFRADDEPMMNLMGTYREGCWTILVFPRVRHRPRVFELEGEAQVLITPASVEMGGLFVTPMEKDFRTLDAGLVRTIYRDVSVDERGLAQIVAAW